MKKNNVAWCIFFGMAAGSLIFIQNDLRAADATIGQIQNQVSKTIRNVSGDVEMDRATYMKISEKKLDKIEDQTKELKTKTTEVTDQKSQEAVNEAEAKKQEAASRFDELKKTGDDNWQEVKPSVDHSLDAAKKSVEKAADRVLTEKEASEWKIQHRIDELDFRIDRLAASAKGLSGAEKSKRDLQLDGLRAAKKKASEHLQAMKRDQSENWKEERNLIDDVLDKAF